MGNRPFTNGSGNATLLINEVLGDAYIVVKRVDDNIDALTAIDGNMAGLLSLEQALPTMEPLLAHADQIGVVGENIAAVDAVAQNIVAVNGAAANAQIAQDAATLVTTKAAEVDANAAAALTNKNATDAAVVRSEAARDRAEAADTSAAGHAASAEASAQLAAEFVANGGVASFNGRTGLVAGEAGDYDADLITETATRLFLAPAERTKIGNVSVTAPVDLDDVKAKANAASPVGHKHPIDDVTGLSIALAGKMSATRTFTLAELTDVTDMAGASDGFVMMKSGSNMVFQAAPWALADHTHVYAVADITGLEDALATKKNVSSEWFGSQAAYDAIGVKDPAVTYFIYAS